MVNITELISIINTSGGSIPISVTTTTTTNWYQLAITLLLSSFFIIYFFGQIFSRGLGNVLAKIKLHSLKKILKKRIILIKHTQSDLFNQSMINQKTLKDLNKALIEFKGKSFDIILHTPGGEIFSALFISRIIKNYKNVRAIIPMYAMSGGTLLSLSCKEIFMGDNASLGPVDPQLGNLFKFGSAKGWNKIVKYKGKKADDQSISFDLIGQQYTKSMKAHLMETIDFNLNNTQKRNLVNYLTSGDIEHGHQLLKQDLINFGINVKPIPDKFMKKVLKILSSDSLEGVHYA